jgi:hypothetical protein
MVNNKKRLRKRAPLMRRKKVVKVRLKQIYNQNPKQKGLEVMYKAKMMLSKH